MQDTATNNQQQQPRRPHQQSRAERTLEHLMTPPTYKEVAIQELKRASVYVPMIFMAAVGALWVNKKLIVKAATAL